MLQRRGVPLPYLERGVPQNLFFAATITWVNFGWMGLNDVGVDFFKGSGVDSLSE